MNKLYKVMYLPHIGDRLGETLTCTTNMRQCWCFPLILLKHTTVSYIPV